MIADGASSELDDDRWVLAKRIALSPSFSRSPRLAHLLMFLCEQALLDRSDHLTEKYIAHAVFGRRESDFDPAADTIVRSHMLRLRQRLETYFEEEGRSETLRISIPKGGYVPIFEAVAEALSVEEKEPDAAADVADFHETVAVHSVWNETPFRLRIRLLTLACILLAVFSSVCCFFLFARRPVGGLPAGRQSQLRQQIWKCLFTGNQNTMIVAADSGLALLHGDVQQDTNLNEYLSRDFSRVLSNIPNQRRNEILGDADRRYTSFIDLELINRITHLPEAASVNYSVRFARDISVNDLKSSNVILSGSQDTNPWVELFEPQMNFVLASDLAHGMRGFSNRSPQKGEDTVYRATQDEYGLLAFLPNLSNTGNVLIIEGTSVAGTQAISDFLFMDSELDPFLQKIRTRSGVIPKFEILLESRSLAGSASRSRIVAYRVH